MKSRIAGLVCGMLLAYPAVAHAMPAAVHISGGGTVTGKCTTGPILYPNQLGPDPGPPCVGSSFGAVAGRTSSNVVVNWHADHAAAACAAPCGDYVATIVSYVDLCASGVVSEIGFAAGAVSITGEADTDALVETLHFDYSLTRVGSAGFTATLSGGFIDMDDDSPGAPDLDSDVALHDPLGLSGSAIGTFTAGPVPPPLCTAPAPIFVESTSVATLRGM